MTRCLLLNSTDEENHDDVIPDGVNPTCHWPVSWWLKMVLTHLANHRVVPFCLVDRRLVDWFGFGVFIIGFFFKTFTCALPMPGASALTTPPEIVLMVACGSDYLGYCDVDWGWLWIITRNIWRSAWSKGGFLVLRRKSLNSCIRNVEMATVADVCDVAHKSNVTSLMIVVNKWRRRRLWLCFEPVGTPTWHAVHINATLCTP